MMIQTTGNLVEMADNGTYDMIVHGCNCQCTMGSGIAAQLRKKWPEIYEADNMTYDNDPAKLGTILPVVVKNKFGDALIVVNAYTQHYYGGDGGRYVNYAAVSECFRRLAEFPNFHQLSVGIPKIGAGLAGGDWNIIAEIINFHCGGGHVVLVNYEAAPENS
jgi:O-acetyl-ADP-ribose deacetylase (regulator of RNase III)